MNAMERFNDLQKRASETLTVAESMERCRRTTTAARLYDEAARLYAMANDVAYENNIDVRGER